jgi:hypothetical protein
MPCSPNVRPRQAGSPHRAPLRHATSIMVPEQRFFSGDVPQDEGAFGGVLLVRVARACGDPGQQDVGGCAEQGDVVELGVELPLVVVPDIPVTAIFGMF